MGDFSMELNEDQIQLQEWVHQFSEDVIRPAAEEWDEREEFPFPIVEQAAEVGLYSWEFLANGMMGDKTGLTLPVAIEELFWGDAGIGMAIMGSGLAAAGIVASGTQEQVLEWVPQCYGEPEDLKIGAFCASEPDAGSDVMGMKSNARRDGDDWILNGSKHFVSGPCMPDFAIVFAATGEDETPRGPRKRITAFLVDVGVAGFECRQGTRCVSYRGYNTYELHFDNVRLSSDKVLGDEGHGLELAGKWLGMGRIWVGATCCGKAERILSMATDWAANRKQFGKPIGAFQATGFRLADGSINLRAADLMVKDAVSRAEEGSMSDADAAMVKVFCSEMLNKIADDAVQIFGGMGLMEEMPIQRFWRDSRLERIWDGTSEIQRHIITRSILRPLGA